MQQLRQICEAAGRDPASLDVAYIALGPVDWTAQKAGDGERRIFTGGTDDMATDVAALEQAGVRHVCLTFQTGDLAETLERIERFAEDVM